ncbi:MAG: CehA/McbA family metallohydrolase [Planctomycetes bacterium]|nr:CehA/McbA family metallohydrolase [Planctomycetota bacterium]
MSQLCIRIWAITAVALAAAVTPDGADKSGKVTIRVVEKSSGEVVPSRIHLTDEAGKPQRAAGLPFWHDHFVCPGSVTLELPPGKYTYEVERGPEYPTSAGELTVRAGAEQQVTVPLVRLANMSAQGWWSGELHVHRPLEDVELLMRAEDLHVAPAISWWNDRNVWQNRALPDEPLVRFDGDRFYQRMGGEDEREGGALLFHNLHRPLKITGSTREYPSPMKFVEQARQQEGAWIDIEKPFWWDVPVWLASGQVNSIGIANNHMCRSQMYETEAWGKPRDATRLPPPLGNGYWTQEIYYHILNCGLRIPPAAGSASGVLPNPVGYNRVYVYLGDKIDYDAWWEGLREGRSFVTNGPLLRVPANGHMPGHVFTAPAGQEFKVDLFIDLISRDPIKVVKIIKNGRVERSVTSEDWSKTDSLGSLTFNESGWFLVRALADNPKTYRFASTAPYYVEIGDARRRVSRASAQFFLDWVKERMQRIKLADPDQRQEVLSHHEQAQRFWEARVASANAP